MPRCPLPADRSRITRFLTITAFCILGSIRSSAAIVVTGYAPTSWAGSDASVGVSGYQVHDFETTTLPPGVQVSVSAPAGSYGPVGTLPYLFNPATDDPNGAQVFTAGTWDGSRGLINRLTNDIPVGYNDSGSSKWGTLTLTFSIPVLSVGFSVDQEEVVSTISVNGTSDFSTGSIPNFTIGSGRNGYLRFDATGGEFIDSITFPNNSGDGFMLDHLAFNTPEPSGLALLMLAASAGLTRRRRAA